MNPTKYAKHDVAVLQNRNPNNIAININKFIAKYDFNIALKVKPQLDELSDGDDDEKYNEESEEVTKRKFNKNAILEILQLCTN